MHLTILKNRGRSEEATFTLDRYTPKQAFFGDSLEVEIFSTDRNTFQARARIVPGRSLPGTLMVGHPRPLKAPANRFRDWEILTGLSIDFGLIGFDPKNDEEIQIIICNDPNPFGEDE